MIDTSQLAFPKPGHAAGRVVLSPSRYRRNKHNLWLAAGCDCIRCGRSLDSPSDAHFHHLKKRGMNGSKRDDRFGKLVCPECHLIEEGQIPPHHEAETRRIA